MIGLELPANKESGDQMTLYTVNISDVSITSQVKAPVFPLNQSNGRVSRVCVIVKVMCTLLIFR